MNLAKLLDYAPSSVARFTRRLTGRLLHDAEVEVPRETIGTAYGSHTIRAGALGPESVVYSFGIGQDASFDLGVIERYGCTVHGFDPTPRSTAWVRDNVRSSKFVFHEIGLGGDDALAVFQRPPTDDRVSYFLAGGGPAPGERGTAPANGTSLPVKRLGTIMAELGHDRLDVLKMDIEGFEYAALDDMLASGLRPTTIAVEYHHGMYGIPNATTLASVSRLRAAGYGLFHVSDTGREYSFLYSGPQAER